MIRRSRHQGDGVLIVEAIVAAFLMVFAFAASTSLFHASLQWEAEGANARRAAMIAEKKMGEIRAWSERFHSTAPFDAGWSAPITGPQTNYPEAPGFAIEVRVGQPGYVPNAGFTPPRPAPPDGVYSPTSHFWEPVPTVPPLPSDFPNPQKNPEYATFSYVRELDSSFRKVEVLVRYGANGSHQFRAISLVGDPIIKGAPSVIFTRTGGPATVALGSPADYRVDITVGGTVVDDIVCVWSVDPLSSGALFVKPKDSSGREVRIFRPDFGSAGTSKLAVRFRFRGVEYTEISDEIAVL